MEVIINKLKKYSPKLANLGSTQAKESFNKTVASKAPKIRLFSVTIGYMIAQVLHKRMLDKGYHTVTSTYLCVCTYG